MESKKVRSQFLEFFKSKGHLIVPSAPIVLKDDPTLMFNNSGMAQFKEYFLGNAVPKSKRIADTQKCLRVSGKHNDLEEVGIDTYHHTMFEMLGNWSFGDYFKKEAITWAWELLTEVYKINKDILYVTVFEGNHAENVPFDKEAYDIWKGLISEDRILLGNKKDNFWEMGDQGPCGPCSEIHVDIRSEDEKKKVDGKLLVNQDHPQVGEIWNNVFMEFNRRANGDLEKLPERHVDTGMGFERLCMVLQHVKSNYDTDVFAPLIKTIENVTGKNYVKDIGQEISDEQNKTNIAVRVIADHVRAVAFAIADGQLPSSTGAGYVIRRILRRAIRYGFTFLDTKEPFIYNVAQTLSDQMGDAFPEIAMQKELVVNVIKEEETSFLRTLDQGLQLLENVIAKTEGNVVDGQKAFELYDTFGFPKDLTALILKEKSMTYDEAGFDNAMFAQKTRSRAASEISTEDWTFVNRSEESFVGYDLMVNEAMITRYRKIDSKKDGELYQIVFDNTPFYPEGGGQIGDQGSIELGGESIEVIDTKKENNVILHFTKKLPKDVSGKFILTVDHPKRGNTASNHTATHLLHQALRHVLGTHVEQKGSLVNSDYLRFDFSHFSKMTQDEIVQVEKFVKDRIQDKLELQERRSIPFHQAVSEGAIALFGEKYSDEVRAIKFGESMELCGGIHVSNTADIWSFKIISEGAVAAGIRRIEAITGNAVRHYFASQEKMLNEISAMLKNPQDTLKALSSLQEENAKLKKQSEQLLKEKGAGLKDDLAKAVEQINGIGFLAQQVDLSAEAVKDLAYELGKTAKNLFIVLASVNDGKPMITCYISKEVVAEKSLNAGNVVRELGKFIQGGGGGQPFFATAGGKDPLGIPEAMEKAVDYIK